MRHPVSDGGDRRMREVEDTVLFSSRSISGKELGIEQFNSPKMTGREGGREGRQGTWETKIECVCV